MNRARFLFGSEASAYLAARFDDLAKLRLLEAKERTPENLELHSSTLDRLSGFNRTLEELFLPYMKLDHKLPQWRRWQPSCRRESKL
jgi:hypothetical protein